jgi:hypothetical protein
METDVFTENGSAKRGTKFIWHLRSTNGWSYKQYEFAITIIISKHAWKKINGIHMYIRFQMKPSAKVVALLNTFTARMLSKSSVQGGKHYKTIHHCCHRQSALNNKFSFFNPLAYM